MKVIAGKEGRGEGMAVMGRLVFPHNERYETARTGEALIPVVYDLNSEILEDTRVVGAVLICRKETETDFHVKRSLPFLTVECGNEKILKEINGKIAYLDVQSRLLISTPDIDTVNKYEKKRQERDVRQRLPVLSKKIPLLSFDVKSALYQEEARGVLVDIDKESKTEDEEHVFDVLTRICDSDPTQKLSVKLSRGASGRETERSFSAAIRGTYRAAVYGNVSIMCGGFSNIEGIEEYVSSLSECICRLEESGREINGFAERGIICDNYELLFSLLSRRISKGVGRGSRILEGIDFICFDIDKLFESCAEKEDARAVTSSLWGIKYIIENFPKYKLIIKTAENAGHLHSLSLEKGWENISLPCEIYVSPKSVYSVKSIISRWREKNTEKN